MKIFLCKGSFFGPASGADQMLVNYAVHLARAGHSPTVVILCQFAADDPYYQRLRSAGVPVVCLGRHPAYLARLGLRRVLHCLPRAWRPRSWTDWEHLLVHACAAFLRRERPEVVHVLVEGGLFLRAARAANVPALYHECVTPREAVEHDHFYRRLEEGLPVAAGLAGVSPRHAQQCRERLPWSGAVGVIPILIEDPVPDGPPARRAGDGPVFGFAARLERIKGPTVLVRAFAAVAPRFPSARLRVAGHGEEEKAVAAEAEALGVRDRCDFAGAYVGREAMSAFMQSLNVLVQPSLVEGTPCSIIEAMAHGLPVIASAVGGVPDMLTAESGILVPPGEVAPLAEAMLRLAGDADLRRRLGGAARRRYQECFSPEAVIPFLVETYHQVIRAYAKREPAEADPPPVAHPWANPSPCSPALLA
jgi:glycosyltransferase involved in cell wall biosynthesis